MYIILSPDKAQVMDKFRYPIHPDKIYLIEVSGKTEEVLEKDILEAYITERVFGKLVVPPLEGYSDTPES